MVSPSWLAADLAISDGAESASDIAQMARAGVTDVIDLRSEFDATPLYAGTLLHLTRVPYVDNGTCQPAAFAAAVRAIDAAFARPGARVIVACAAGEYRSPAAVYAWLRVHGATPEAAWATVVSHRRIAKPQYLACVEAWLGGHTPITPGATLGVTTTRRPPRWPLVLGGAGLVYGLWRVYGKKQ